MQQARSRFSTEQVIFVGAALVLIVGIQLPLAHYLSPKSGLGYAIGIVGGSLILAQLLYAVRKRVPALRFLGSVPGWFQTHMVMGIIGFMRGLANDVATDGITANAVLPGLTNTQATAPQSEEQKRATWDQQAIKQLGQPEDMTGAILFLTSDDAAFITGQAIVVDGGQYRIG